jgi:hypothetical protein
LMASSILVVCFFSLPRTVFLNVLYPGGTHDTTTQVIACNKMVGFPIVRISCRIEVNPYNIQT